MPVAQKPSLSDGTSDPLRDFLFVVTFRPHTGASFTGGFMTVSGLGSQTMAIINYQQGGQNVTTRMMPGQGTPAPLIMTTGSIFTQNSNVKWINHVYDVVQGTGANITLADDFRMDMDVYVLDHPVTTKNRMIKAGFRVWNAWPSVVNWGDLDAGDNGILVEQLTLCHEGIDVQIALPGALSEIPGYP